MFDTLQKLFTSEPKFNIRLDSRNSFITTQSVKLLGLKAGLEFGGRLRLGLGYYWLASHISEDITLPNKQNGLDTFPGRLKFRYLAYYIEYAFYQNRNWEFSVPFQIGFGNSLYRYENEMGKKRSNDFGPAVLIAPGVEANYKILPWLGFGLGIGYRIMLLNNPAIKEHFSAPIYVIKLKIYPKEAIAAFKALK